MVRKLDFRTLNNSVLALLVTGVIAVGVFRIFLTYDVFWQTWDEAAHIAAGMEWLDEGRYTYEMFHGPLARVSAAIGLYFVGVRSAQKADMWKEGNAILLANDNYERHLTLARMGILPFFILASVVVVLWAKIYGATLTALLSLLLFTTLPAILGHAALATTDMSAAATGILALFLLDRWLDEPNWFRSALLGSGIGLACLAKFTALGFVGLCAALMAVVYGLEYKRTHNGQEKKILGPAKLTRRIKGITCALVTGFIVIWAGYRFTVHWVEPTNRPHTTIDRIFGRTGLFHNISYTVLENTPIPAPEFALGILEFTDRNKHGHHAYLLGEVRRYGWWYFFPLVLSIKTPLAFLVLSSIGVAFVFKNALGARQELRLFIPLLCVIGILGLTTQSQVNSGTRLVLIVYPLLAMLAGYGAAQLLSFTGYLRYAGTVLAVSLLLWHIASSIAAHPDYISYFNEIAQDQPEEFVVESDLDWGQDLKRLSRTVRSRGIESLKIQYFGSAPLDDYQFGLPSIQRLQPKERAAGWIAISLTSLKLGTGNAPYDQFAWLSKYHPVEKVGKSIWLYNVPSE